MAAEPQVPNFDQASVQPSTHAAAGDQSIASVSVVMGDGNQAKKNKVPRRILHFSDGILEEYSTDEDEDESDKAPLQPVDPKTLEWMPWMWFHMSTAAYKAWSVADFCGEKLAWFFGITTPKYQSAIDEYYRRKEEEEREKAEEEKRLSRSTLNTDISMSSIDVTVLEEDKVVVGDGVEKY